VEARHGSGPIAWRHAKGRQRLRLLLRYRYRRAHRGGERRPPGLTRPHEQCPCARHSDLERYVATEREVLENCFCHETPMPAHAVTRLYDDTWRSVGLRATQLAVLAAVGGDEVVSIAGLAKFMGMDRSTLTRNLAPLEREGLIWVGVEGWRRSRTVEITKKGRSRLGEALPLWEKAQETMQRRLGIHRWVDIRADLDDLIRSAP